MSTDKLPEPVAWRVGSSYFTKETSIPPALRVFDWEPLYTADQLRAAIAEQAEAHAAEVGLLRGARLKAASAAMTAVAERDALRAAAEQARAAMAEWLAQGGYFDIEHHAALRALDDALGSRVTK